MAQQGWAWILAAALWAAGNGPAAAQESPGDRAYLQGEINRVLEFERTGTESPWTNPETGNSGNITITRTYFRDPETPCRDYFRTTESEGGKPFSVKGTGCRRNDGSWELSERKGRGTASGSTAAATEAKRQPAGRNPEPRQPAPKDPSRALPKAAGKAQADAPSPPPVPKSATKKRKRPAKPSMPTIVARLPQASDDWEPNGGASGGSGGPSPTAESAALDPGSKGTGDADASSRESKTALLAPPDAPPLPPETSLKAALAAIPADQKLALPFEPEIGSTARYEVVKSKLISGPKKNIALRTTSQIELTALKRNEEGYVHRYALTEAKVYPADDKVQEGLQAFEAMMSEVTFAYQSDPVGVPSYIRDWGEVQADLNKRLVEASDFLDAVGDDPSLSPGQRLKWKSFVAIMATSFADMDEASGNARLLQVPRLLYFATGSELPKETTVEYEAEVFAPALGRNVKVIGKYWFENIDKKAGTAEVGWEQSYDPETIALASDAVIDRLSAMGGIDEEEEARAVIKSTGNLEVIESGRFKMDLADGMPLEVAYEKAITAGTSVGNTESLTIKRLDP